MRNESTDEAGIKRTARVQKEQRRERIRERRERREEEERRKKKRRRGEREIEAAYPAHLRLLPLPPPPPLAPPPLMPLPPPPPTTIEQYTQKKSKISSQQRMSFSSGSTSTSSAYSMHPALMRNNNRTSGLSGLGRASVERRQTNQSISSRDGSFRAGGGLKVPQEFEDLVAGHMNETGEAPPTYNQLLQEACLRTNGGKYGARGGRVTVVSSEDVEL
ncbi:hypothetical protein BT96DRAFT_999920 [Gymnopus androsaceus JB14]|uniref:Uncharacterized protein n=1 Tax=Gymnopus androsaceus JB14 TaxID=1447944 RepID=A0A6A4H4C9_9AGAR|nr:hypothetical protein BT96DRAFT_999920 [Gymnopus androsaceus JB14]